jgi:hypothetical protein
MGSIRGSEARRFPKIPNAGLLLSVARYLETARTQTLQASGPLSFLILPVVLSERLLRFSAEWLYLWRTPQTSFG